MQLTILRPSDDTRRSPGYSLAILVATFLMMLGGTSARAQSALLAEAHTAATLDIPAPVEHSLDISAAGTYQVSLTDLGTPAPLGSLQLFITTGSTLIPLAVTGNAIPQPDLSAAGTTQTAQFTVAAAATGTYVVHVIGVPGSPQSTGNFGVGITNTADGSQLPSGTFSQTLALPAARALDGFTDTFSVSASANYSVTLTDVDFPHYLNTVTLTLMPAGGYFALANLALTQGAPPSQTQAVALQAGIAYSVNASAKSNSTPNDGVYAVVIRDAGGAIVYSRTVTEGSVVSVGTASLTPASQYTLSFTDLQLPAALSPAGPQGALVALNDQVAAELTTAGSATFTAAGGQYQVLGIGTPTSVQGNAQGSYLVDLRLSNSATAVLSVPEAMPLGNFAYSFDANIPTAGTYNLQLANYGAKSGGLNLAMMAIQNGKAVGSLTAAGATSVTASAGNLSMFVYAWFTSNPPYIPGPGVFGLFLTPGGGSPIFETNQIVPIVGFAVNGFASRKVTVATPGNYALTLTDLELSGFNAGDLYALLTQGPTVIGTANSSTPSSSQPLIFAAPAAADYFLNVIALPGFPVSVGGFGSYAVNLAPSAQAPAAPTLTLSSDISHVPSGGSANLTWSSQNATSCIASGAWSGNPASSGTANTGPLTVGGTFTLTCSNPADPGVSATQSVTITVDPTLTLSSDVSHVPSGGSANLTWSSQNATSCVASGAWSGNRASSGTANTGPLTVGSTFTLTCSNPADPSVSAAQSVMIAIDPAPTPPPASGSHGGGGALDLITLAILSMFALLRGLARRRPAFDFFRSSRLARTST